MCIILFLLTLTYSVQPQKLVVKTDLDLKEIHYWPLNGEQLPYYDLSTIINIRSEEATAIILPQGECLYHIIMGDRSFKIYSFTGSVDSIYFYNGSLSFSGDSKKYNDFLIEAEKSDTYCRNYSRRGDHALLGINNLSDFYKIVDSLKVRDLLLLANGDFSEFFVTQQKLFTEMRYNALFLMKMNSLYRSPDLTNEWVNELRDKDFLLTHELSRQSDWFYKILKDYVFAKSLIVDENNPQDIMAAYNTFMYDSYCKTLNDTNLKYALACFFYDDIFQEEYSKEMPVLYNRFMSLFPNSSYSKILNPGIKRIEDLYNENDDSRILIVNYETEPKSFKDIMFPFSGKVVYIDVWATSCSPCLKMFTHLNDLKEKTRELENVVFFYISVDQDRNHEKWQKMINYYHLHGYHYRVNKQTSSIIYSSLSDSNGMLSIPRYVIIDKNGEIAFANAASPAEAEKVAEQLKTLLK
jgi:thiol-disulfide isomerase/thioredoxin